ncbi:AcrR family transcriptional regulator [Mycobacterium sp. MAA66]|uniref:TetR/AcrR family transcriptional regulator n=1 Tax=Mycobacterium sp. MAA66 TaxID=3156297 RepID=UPI003517FC0A
MVGGVSRESYFEAGVEALAEAGYNGLKLAEVCRRLGVTTGSFYHYFPNWAAYTDALLEHWAEARSMKVDETQQGEPDPRVRIDTLIRRALALPHGAEAAIRIWSALDPKVHAVQSAVDQQRFDAMSEAAFEILGDRHQANVFASWGLYVLVGYEQSTLKHTTTADLHWIAEQLLDALDSGRFSTVPGG